MIDVAISSCARPDILETSVESFLTHIKSRGEFRLILCEDKVEDPKRQEAGRKWIEDHSHYFDQIIYSDKRLTYVYCFSEILKYMESPYFFRLEDDVTFFEDIDVDEIIEFMEESSVSQTIFRREIHNLTNPVEVKYISNRKTELVDFYSIATGVFNLNWTERIIGMSGTGECHESSVLTPAMLKLGAKSSVIYGVDNVHALNSIGDDLGYIKGSWK